MSKLSAKILVSVWRPFGQCCVTGQKIYRSDRGDLRVGPCPSATKEPGPTESTPPKREVAAAPMAPKATAKVSAQMAPKATVPEVKVSAPTAPKATRSATPAAKPAPSRGEPSRPRPGHAPARMAPKAAVHEVKVSAPMAPKATGSTTPAAKPAPAHGEPRRPWPGQVPKTVPEPYAKGNRGETKSGPQRPNQQRQQPPTKVEPCWHFERNRGWCPWRDRCRFGHVKKSKAKKRREARARQRARARNAASSSTPQASAPQTADLGSVPGNPLPTAQKKADDAVVSPARPSVKRPRPSTY
jgi:hypothetical protein